MVETTEADKQDQEATEAAQLQKDVEGFNADLIPLLGKYNVGLGATAFIAPDGRIGARPTLFRAAPPAKKDEASATAPTAPSTPAAETAVAAPLEGAE